MAAFAPSGLLPDFRIRTGFLYFLVICLQTLRNSWPLPMSSRYITITFVWSCSASILSKSISFKSALFPTLITAENPIPCALASSTSAAQIAPLCDISAICPDLGVTLRKVEFIIVFGSRFITPRQLGPIIRMPYFLTIVFSCSSSFLPASSTSLNPAVITMTPLIFFLPHSSRTAGTMSFFVTTIAKSIDSATSSTLLYAFMSNTTSRVGEIG